MILVGLAAMRAQAGPTLDHVEAQGLLTCGVSTGMAGFALADAQGVYHGFDVDICRAISAALFGSPDKVRFVAVDSLQQFQQQPEIDLVLRGLTWSFRREVVLGLRFGPVIFHDGQSFLVRKGSGVTKLRQLAGRPVCVQSDSGALEVLTRYFHARRLALRAIVFDNLAAAEKAFRTGRCTALSADISELAASRIAAADDPAQDAFLPERISREPLAPLLRAGDDGFFDLVRWTIFAMIDAEALGIDSGNVDRALASHDPDIRSLLDAPPNMPPWLDARWVYRIIRNVGNYGEVYRRNLGSQSRARLPRGPNGLWTQGGLIYAPPLR